MAGKENRKSIGADRRNWSTLESRHRGVGSKCEIREKDMKQVRRKKLDYVVLVLQKLKGLSSF